MLEQDIDQVDDAAFEDLEGASFVALGSTLLAETRARAEEVDLHDAAHELLCAWTDADRPRHFACVCGYSVHESDSITHARKCEALRALTTESNANAE